jgi:hypothetical protein
MKDDLYNASHCSLHNSYLDMATAFGISKDGRNRGKPDCRECGNDANQSHWTVQSLKLKSEIVNSFCSKSRRLMIICWDLGRDIQ